MTVKSGVAKTQQFESNLVGVGVGVGDGVGVGVGVGTITGVGVGVGVGRGVGVGVGIGVGVGDGEGDGDIVGVGVGGIAFLSVWRVRVEERRVPTSSSNSSKISKDHVPFDEKVLRYIERKEKAKKKKKNLRQVQANALWL